MVIDHTPHPTNGTLSSPAIMDLPSVTISGPVAYSAQESWLAKGTIKDAILFGRPYNETRYKAAIQDSGLEADIAEVTDDYKSMSDFLQATSAKGMLSHMADVGEGGSSLSGGQRARVALARALYDAEAKVFLLDDPFAALDASVGSSVFTSVTKRLRKEKAAAILVTNDPSIPRRCDKGKQLLFVSLSSIFLTFKCSHIDGQVSQIFITRLFHHPRYWHIRRTFVKRP